jgi:hypothetical protein
MENRFHSDYYHAHIASMNQKSLRVVVCKIKTRMSARIRIVIIELLVTEDMYDGLYDKPGES